MDYGNIAGLVKSFEEPKDHFGNPKRYILWARERTQGSNSVDILYYDFQAGSWSPLLPKKNIYKVKCASDKNISNLSSVNIIGGVQVSENDLVLLKEQSNSIENGIYEVSPGSAGSLHRSLQRPTSYIGQIYRDHIVYVSSGTNKFSAFGTDTTRGGDTIIVDTDPINFIPISTVQKSSDEEERVQQSEVKSILVQRYETIGTEVGDTQKDYNEKNQAIVAALVGNVPPPNYLDPTMSISPGSSVRKIGGNYNVNISLSYSKRDGGGITSQKIEKNGTKVSDTNTFSETLVVPIGITTYKGTINYDQGPIKDNAIGIPDPRGRVTAGTLTRSTTVEGVYPLFGTTSNITTGTEQPLVSMVEGNNVVLNLVAESGVNKQFFDIPQDWLDNRPLTKIEIFDFNTNAWNSQNQLSTFTAVANTHTINGNVVNYKRYTHNASNRGSVRMRLIF